MTDYQFNRRTVLRTAAYASLFGSGLTSVAGNAQAQDVVTEKSTSFETESVGDTEPADPWFLFGDGGIHEVRDTRTSDGDQSFYTADAPLGEPSAIAITLDVTAIDTIKSDIYIENASQANGNIKISKDSAGYPQDAEDNLSNFTSKQENTWHRDLETDIADIENEHTITFWVDGDNAAYWDNIRFFSSAAGNVIDDFESGELEEEWVQPETAPTGRGGFTVQSEVAPQGEYALRGDRNAYDIGDSSEIQRDDFTINKDGSTLRMYAKLGPRLDGDEQANRIRILGEENEAVLLDQKDRPGNPIGNIGNDNDTPALDSLELIELKNISFTENTIREVVVGGEVVATDFDFTNDVSSIEVINIYQGHFEQPADIIVDEISYIEGDEPETQPVTIEATRTSTTVQSPVTVQVTDPTGDDYEYRWKVDKKPDGSDPGLLHGQNHEEIELNEEERNESEPLTLGQKPRERKPHAVLRPDKPTGDSEPYDDELYELEVEVYDENEELIGSETTEITVKQRKLEDYGFSIEGTDTVSELVETYAPVLHFHSEEDYFPTRYEAYVENSELRLPDDEPIDDEVTLLDIGKSDLDDAYDPTDRGNSLWLGESEAQFKTYQKRYPSTVHASVTITEFNGEEYLALTYWFFYLFDPKREGSIQEPTAHPSDTETVTILLNEDGPQWVAAAQHKSGEYVEWETVEDSYISDSTHINVYPALGAHSSFLVNTEKYDNYDFIPAQYRWALEGWPLVEDSTRQISHVRSDGDLTDDYEDWTYDDEIYDIVVFPSQDDEQPGWTQFAGFFDAEPGGLITDLPLGDEGRLPMQRDRWENPGSWITNNMLREIDVLDNDFVINTLDLVRDDLGCITAFEVNQIRYQDEQIRFDGWPNPGSKPHTFFIDSTVTLGFESESTDELRPILDVWNRDDNFYEPDLSLGWTEIGSINISLDELDLDDNATVEIETEVLTHESEASNALSDFPVSDSSEVCTDEGLSVSLGEVNLL